MKTKTYSITILLCIVLLCASNVHAHEAGEGNTEPPALGPLEPTQGGNDFHQISPFYQLKNNNYLQALFVTILDLALLGGILILIAHVLVRLLKSPTTKRKK